LKIGEEIEDKTIDLLKKYNFETRDMLILISKLSKNIKEKTIMSYKDGVVEALRKANVSVK